MSSARLFRVIVPVSRIEDAALFYSAVLGEPGRRISPGRHYFGCGGVILACFDPRADGDPWDAQPNPDHLYFAVDNLEDYFSRVSSQPDGSIDRGIETQPNPDHLYFAVDNLEDYFSRVSSQPDGSIDRGIETQPWGERSFYCRDPFGNKLCFVEDPTKFTGGLI